MLGKLKLPVELVVVVFDPTVTVAPLIPVPPVKFTEPFMKYEHVSGDPGHAAYTSGISENIDASIKRISILCFKFVSS